MKKRETASWPEPLYLDASALVKLLVSEAESDALNKRMLGAADVVVSELAVSEAASALGRRVRERVIDVEQARRLLREALKLLSSCRGVELTPPIHRRAERLLISTPEPLRTLDALHLAIALEAKAATMVTYDHRLGNAARSQGLFVGC
jgi:uncharacterized protein